jgi:hypothetical protein
LTREQQIERAYQTIQEFVPPSPIFGEMYPEPDVAAREWCRLEDEDEFPFGCTNYSTAPAAVIAYEAVHLLCNGLHDADAYTLLRIAADTLGEHLHGEQYWAEQLREGHEDYLDSLTESPVPPPEHLDRWAAVFGGEVPLDLFTDPRRHRHSPRGAAVDTAPEQASRAHS